MKVSSEKYPNLTKVMAGAPEHVIAVTRNEIEKELAVQEEIEGTVENKDLILKIIHTCKNSSEISALLTTRFHRYGKFSYEAHRFWYVKSYMLPLFK